VGEVTRARAAADRAWNVNVVVIANAVVVVGLWLRHGGVGQLHQAGGLAVALGQLTALLGTYGVLIQLLLMSRIGWLERWVGFDRLALWHRWGGFGTVSLLGAHAVFTAVGYAQQSRQSLMTQTLDFVRHYPDVLMAIVGLALLVVIAVSSIRIARQRVARETWHALHLYAYAAVALSFAHQLSVGSDFADDRVARWWWSGLFVAVVAVILVWRVGRPVVFNFHHRLRVHAVRREAKGVVSVYISGRRLHEIEALAGQFFLWRFLTPSGWARAHPYSLSAPPGSDFLRITIKGLGDDSRRAQHLHAGVRVFAEGPYGTFTTDRRKRRKVALIAGGIGITPIRALVESLAADPGDVTLLYRVATDDDIAFGKELRRLAERRGVDLRVLVGTDVGDDETDQLGVPQLRALLPDIARRDVYLCGPPAMVDAVRRRLHRLRVPRAHVHFERFAY
jgi:predicted ferric reductase